jgi:hypothetical protein
MTVPLDLMADVAVMPQLSCKHSGRGISLRLFSNSSRKHKNTYFHAKKSPNAPEVFAAHRAERLIFPTTVSIEAMICSMSKALDVLKYCYETFLGATFCARVDRKLRFGGK